MHATTSSAFNGVPCSSLLRHWGVRGRARGILRPSRAHEGKALREVASTSASGYCAVACLRGVERGSIIIALGGPVRACTTGACALRLRVTRWSVRSTRSTLSSRVPSIESQSQLVHRKCDDLRQPQTPFARGCAFAGVNPFIRFHFYEIYGEGPYPKLKELHDRAVVALLIHSIECGDQR